MNKIFLSLTIMLITLTGCTNKEVDTEKYENIEKQVEIGAIKYGKDLNISNVEKVQTETLLYGGHITDTVLMEDDGTFCGGYALIQKNDNDICAEAYIQCKDYTSENYGTLEMKKDCV